MSKYLIKNVLKNINVHKVAYIFFALQIAISFVILLIFTSISASVSADYDEIKNDVTSKSISFSLEDPYATQESASDMKKDTTIKYEDYKYLKSKYSDVLSVSYVYREVFSSFKDGEFTTAIAFFATDEFFYNGYYNPNIKNFETGNTIYAPTHFKEMIKNILNTTDSNINIFNTFLTNKKLKDYSYVDINKIHNGNYNYIFHAADSYYQRRNQNTVLLNDAIIIPIGLYEPIDADNPYYTGSLSINFYGVTDTVVLKEIVQYFEQKYGNNGQLECTFNSPLSEAKTYISSQIILSETFKTIAYVCLAIVGIGFIGLLLIIFENRIKKMAISLVMGATYKQLYLEAVLEIEAVILLGTAVGGIATYYIINYLNKAITAIDIKANSLAITYLITGIIISGVLMSFIVLNKIMKIAPNEVLKKE